MSESTSPTNNYTPEEVPQLGLPQGAPQLNNNNNNIPPLPSHTTINYSTPFNNNNTSNTMSAAPASAIAANQLDPQYLLCLQMMIQQQQRQQYPLLSIPLPYGATPPTYTYDTPMPAINNAISNDGDNGIDTDSTNSTTINNVKSTVATNDNDNTAAAPQISPTTDTADATSNIHTSTVGGGVANVNRGADVNVGSDIIGGGDVRIPLCSEVGSTAPSPPPFIKGQIVSLEEYDNTMSMYAVNNGYELQRSQSNKKDRVIPTTYYKWQCSRAGKPSNKGNGARPQRTSLKVGCGCYANACHPMKEDKTGRDETVVEIIGIDLRHTNGCTGDNELVNKSIRRRRGRNYSDVGLNHLKIEVKAGRYTTHDVKSWLHDQGMKDATLREATNLRYRLMKDMPVKGYEFDEKDSAELGAMEDCLYNEDLAREVMAGAKESVDNLRIVHKGLKCQVKGYDYRITTDSENRFSGTVWMTGRMRARLRRYGIFLFLDDSRSGINSSGFCFWSYQ